MSNRITASGETIMRQSFMATVEGYNYFKEKLPELNADQLAMLCVAANTEASGVVIAQKIEAAGTEIAESLGHISGAIEDHTKFSK
jgi:hypothetical protein